MELYRSACSKGWKVELACPRHVSVCVQVDSGCVEGKGRNVPTWTTRFPLTKMTPAFNNYIISRDAAVSLPGLLLLYLPPPPPFSPQLRLTF